MIKQIVNIICFFAIFWINVCNAEIRVAIIVPKTGEYKVWGDELVFGAKTAIDEINASGGILNEKVELVVIDDTCNDNLAISTAQMLSVSSSIKPSLVVGPYCSNSFNDVAKIYSKSKIFQVVPIALKYHDMSLNHKGVMKLVSFKEQVGKDFFSEYNKKYAGLKTAFVYDDATDGSKEIVKAVSDEFKKHGKGSLLKEFRFERYNDLDNLTNDIISSGIDIVYLMGNPKKNGKLIKKISEINPHEVFFISKYLATDDFFENSKNFLNNVFFMSLPTFENNPNFTENMVNLRLKGIEFEGLNIYGYAAIKTWTSLVEKTGSFSYDKISEQIKNKNFHNMWSEAFFNNTNIKNPIHYVFYKYINDEFVLVE